MTFDRREQERVQMKFEVRAARDQDIWGITRCYIEAFPYIIPEGMPDEHIAIHFSKRVPDFRVILDEGGEVISMAMLEPQALNHPQRIGLPDLVKEALGDENTLYISDMATTHRYQKRGFATRHLINAEAEAQKLNIKTAYLSVSTLNPKAIELYEKLQFDKIATEQRNYLPEPQWVMVRKFGGSSRPKKQKR